jgi:hypothetical protein
MSQGTRESVKNGVQMFCYNFKKMLIYQRVPPSRMLQSPLQSTVLKESVKKREKNLLRFQSYLKIVDILATVEDGVLYI